MTRSPLLRRLASLLVVLLLALPAHATWSIVVVNHRTGEVAVASATCVPDVNLDEIVGVVIPGVAAGAVQAFVDDGNRVLMYDSLRAGLTPAETLEILTTIGTGPPLRQYGMAAFSGPAASYSGNRTLVARPALTGSFGDLSYAIQGNILVDDEVALVAEAALVETPGDLGQKLLAAMLAARDRGGDGRCSCGHGNPPSCGEPPPDFRKAAHSGFLIVARVGDTDGGCGANGCARGDYYLHLRDRGRSLDPDPVFVIRDLYADWRAERAGHPDHVLTEVKASVQALPADGRAQARVRIALRDVEGARITQGGAKLTALVVDDSGARGGALLDVGPAFDRGDGTYELPLTAGTRVGTARLEITVDDGSGAVRLYPDVRVALDAPAPLHSGFAQVSASEGARVPFTLDLPGAVGRPYLVMGSASGSVPGMTFAGVHVPLNVDELVVRSMRNANNARFPNTRSVLDGTGWAQGALDAPPGLLRNLVGHRLDWAAVWRDASGGFHATDAVSFVVGP